MLADIDIAALISRWFHITAAIVAVGGTVFLRLVLHPVGQAAVADDARRELWAAIARRWARVLHVAILFLILTGFYNFVNVLRSGVEPMPYHGIFTIKFLLALALFFIAIALTGRSAAFEGMRKKAPQWMMINVVIAAVIVLLSNVLKNTSAPLGG